jgi:hypothetical protein
MGGLRARIKPKAETHSFFEERRNAIYERAAALASTLSEKELLALVAACLLEELTHGA